MYLRGRAQVWQRPVSTSAQPIAKWRARVARLEPDQQWREIHYLIEQGFNALGRVGAEA